MRKKTIQTKILKTTAVPAAITDTGCERELNEDRYAVVDSPSGVAWIICDGMGGVTGGELAAQLAVDAIKRDLESLDSRPLLAAVRSAIVEANRIITLRRQNQAFTQMGTTTVVAAFYGIELVIGWVGDSRAYLISSGHCIQLTKDHTYVQQLVDNGEITAEEALTHPDGHILTKCIGAEPSVGIDFKRLWLHESNSSKKNDSIMLCSDGLYSLVSDTEIASIIESETPQHACVKLVDLAKERGGYDNITVAIIPLGGGVKDKPPAGYNEEQEIKIRFKNTNKVNKKDIGWLKTVIGIVSLSVIAGLCGIFAAFSIC